MMAKRHQKDRTLPSEDEVIAALQWLASRETTSEPRTIIMKVRNPSRQTKIPRLLNTHIYATNLKNRILNHYAESPVQQRTDGAIAMVLRVQHMGLGRARQLGALISSEYLVLNLTDEDRLYSGRLRQGVCREVAQILINWVQDITGTILSASTLKLDTEVGSQSVNPAKSTHKRSGTKRKSRKKRDALMTVDQAYAAWQQKQIQWEAAANTPIPFGKYNGTPLKEIGRREARWLLERLLPVDEIKETLDFVDQLLEDPHALAHDAAYEEHPFLWDRGVEFKHRRAVRAHRLVQRVLDPPGELVLLGMLHKDELRKLRNELSLLRKAGEQFESLLPSLQEGLREAQQFAEFSDFEHSTFKSFQDVFETFLFEKPPDYPEITLTNLTDEHMQELRKQYGAALRWFRPNPKIPGDFEKYVDEDKEARARERLLRAQGQLILPKLQPIPFLGTMQPARYNKKTGKMLSPTNRDYALLFDKETGEYVAVVWLRGRNDPITPKEQAERAQKRAQQRHTGRLYYANFPETLFDPSDRSSYLLLPLEWGEQSNRRRFREKRQPVLAKLIELQRKRQKECHDALSAPARPLPIGVCLPEETIFQGGRLVLKWDAQGNPEFFLHVKVALPTSRPELPEMVIGFSEHEEGYSFAKLKLNGEIIDVGDVIVPEHVDPAYGAKRSENYIYEVVHAMLREAGTAYIGIEDTSYKKNEVSLDRRRNRDVLGRPSGRICATLVSKGAEVGVLRPRPVRDVSPARDCSACRTRHPEGTSCREQRNMIQCPAERCQTWQVWDSAREMQQCCACGHNWKVTADAIRIESYFVCPTCQQSARPARHNTAIIVAQETLRELKQHWGNGLSYERRKQQRVVGSAPEP